MNKPKQYIDIKGCSDPIERKAFIDKWWNWKRKGGISGFANHQEAYDWLKAHGWRFRYNAVFRIDPKKPYAPDNLVVKRMEGKDGTYEYGYVSIDSWNETVAKFKEAIANASERDIDRTVARVRAGTLWPIKNAISKDK